MHGASESVQLQNLDVTGFARNGEGIVIDGDFIAVGGRFRGTGGKETYRGTTCSA
jgi:hypothetical protein